MGGWTVKLSQTSCAAAERRCGQRMSASPTGFAGVPPAYGARRSRPSP
jgi:hypothetical protein